MNKKGFTLVELLSVIAILAILVIIALPNVLSMYNNARKSSFITELKSVYTAAEEKWITDSFSGSGTKTYAHCSSSNCDNELKLSGRDDLEYYIEFNSKGKVVKYYAKDNSFQYSYEGSDLKKNDINEVQSIPEVTNGKYVQIACTGGKLSSPPPASIDYYLMAGTNTSENKVYLRTSILKEEIEKVTFTDSLNGHSANGTDCWDVSYGSNGSVLAWATDTDENGLYEITIGANGDVYPSTGDYLFYKLTNATVIDGLEYLKSSSMTSAIGMFAFTEKLTSLNIPLLDTSNITNMFGMFAYSRLPEYDLSHFNTSKVTNMGSMFTGNYKVTSLDVSSFDTSNVTDMSYMFSGIREVTSLDVSNFDTSKVTTMKGMFDSDSKAFGLQTGGATSTRLQSLDLSNFDTSNVTDMSNMFHCGGSGAPCSIRSLNLSSFDTSKVTDMHRMFCGCHNLTSLDLSNFNTSSLKDMGSMFYNCHSLTELDLSNFNTSNVTDMSATFWGCQRIQSLDLSSFDTSNVTKMTNMFNDCGNLTNLNVSSFNTSNVRSMSGMFSSCYRLPSLDISNFDTSKVTNMSKMFNYSSNLVTVYVGDAFDTNAVTSSSDMFLSASSIVGGAGTTYDENNLDKTYARIDGGESNPGYFTRK